MLLTMKPPHTTLAFSYEEHTVTLHHIPETPQFNGIAVFILTCNISKEGNVFLERGGLLTKN